MCGVAGFINIDGAPASSAILKAMTDAIIHRGPDGEGHWIKDNIGIGHRRLAIIDPSPAGYQPMVSDDQRYVLSYNGEIYNYRELRKELEAEGFHFRSKTDSEVVLYALVKWGPNAFLKFNGMFALVLWDQKEKKLLLARDRYGIKPIYYSNSNNTFSFGSEQKAITIQPDFQCKLNKPTLLEYFTFQNIFNNQTLLQNIYLLPAGNYAILDCNKLDAKIKLYQYWDYFFREPDYKASETEYMEELDRLFARAVNRQLVSDVELGVYLSGGIDSGSITALASKQIPNLKSFTIGFDLSSASGMELAFDERFKAEFMSGLFKTEHYEMVLKSGDMESCMKNLTWHLEEPRIGQSYPNYYAAKLCSKFVKVVLSGTGGDELFGGYPWRYYQASNSQNFETYINNYYYFWQRLLSDSEIKKLFNPIWSEVEHVCTRDIFREVFKGHSNKLEKTEDFINHSLYFESKTFLHSLFVVEDKLSMCHGLESRVPFMDNDLVDFAMQCPANLKLGNLSKIQSLDENQVQDKFRNLKYESYEGKKILRKMMKKYLPKKILNSPKQGFSSPDASWFKGDSIEFVKRRLLNGNSHINKFFDSKTIKVLINQHLSGKKNRRLLIWSLLSIDNYLKDIL